MEIRDWRKVQESYVSCEQPQEPLLDIGTAGNGNDDLYQGVNTGNVYRKSDYTDDWYVLPRVP